MGQGSLMHGMQILTRRRLDWPITSFRDEYFDFARVSAAVIIENTVELMHADDELAAVLRALESAFSHPRAPAHVRLGVAAAHQAVMTRLSRPYVASQQKNTAADDDEVFFDARDDLAENEQPDDEESDGGGEPEIPYRPLDDDHV